MDAFTADSLISPDKPIGLGEQGGGASNFAAALEYSACIAGDTVRAYMHTASEEVRPRPSPSAPPPSASEAATCREPTSLLGRIASPT